MKLADAVVTAYQNHPGMHLEVFVHKADVLSEEYKIGVSRSCSALSFYSRPSREP